MSLKKSSITGILPKSLKRVFAAVTIAAGLTGCATLHNTNSNLYNGGNDVESRYSQLRKGMTMNEFVAVMGNDITQQWQDIDNVAKTEVKCGCQLKVDSLDKMDAAANQVAQMDGFQITYEDVVSDPHYFGIRKKVETDGYSVTMRFVFENGRLSAWDRKGGPVHQKRSTPYIDFDGFNLNPKIGP